MMKYFFAIFFVGAICLAFTFTNPEDRTVEDFFDSETTVRSVLEELGSELSYNHELDETINGVSIERGEDIVKKGFTRSPKGRKSSRISKHFVCTSCHNIEREDPHLAIVDPQARLEYTHSLGIPFLQGSALYGIVNRESFYNDDYEKKYGILVKAARNDLRQAIQLCATECSSGRLMKEWELESVLAYLWTLELKMSDLVLSRDEEKMIADALETGEKTKEAIEKIESKYLKHSPAHFIEPPSTREERRMVKGNADNGELIYSNSCMHCHGNRRYAFFNLDFSRATFRNLKKNLDNYHERSIYQVSRYGTSPISGKRTYMPQYTIEKLSVAQLEDLKAYIVREAR